MKKGKIKTILGIAITIYAIITTVLLIIPKENRTLTKNNISTSKKTLAIYINEGDGNYTISNSRKFPKEGYILNTEKSTCKNGGTLSQDPVTKSISGSFSKADSCNLYFDKEQSGVDLILTALKLRSKEGTPDFANTATTDETADGLYAMEDDYGTSYYFRGAVENNYVKFGGFYWRIIRINGDGSLRMIYDGEQAYANGTSDTGRLAVQNISFNTNYKDNKYVGYMYGPAGTTASTNKEQAQTNTENSTIKTELETWYKTNIADMGLDEYVADSIYCNDRTIKSGDGYGAITTHYGGYTRLGAANTVNPQFTCEQKNDAFTKSDTTEGNGALSEKVGLITADEIVAAGSGKYSTVNTNYYLYKGSDYWSLSPSDYYSGGFGRAYGFYVRNTGNLSNTDVNVKCGISPVISLTPEYASTLKGSGTMESPYEAP